jgi:hypothetical protein
VQDPPNHPEVLQRVGVTRCVACCRGRRRFSSVMIWSVVTLSARVVSARFRSASDLVLRRRAGAVPRHDGLETDGRGP